MGHGVHQLHSVVSNWKLILRYRSGSKAIILIMKIQLKNVLIKVSLKKPSYAASNLYVKNDFANSWSMTVSFHQCLTTTAAFLQSQIMVITSLFMDQMMYLLLYSIFAISYTNWMESLREPAWATTLGVGRHQPVSKVPGLIKCNDLARKKYLLRVN